MSQWTKERADGRQQEAKIIKVPFFFMLPGSADLAGDLSLSHEKASELALI